MTDTNCEHYEEKGRHSYTAAPGTERDRNGDPIDMICRYCGDPLHIETPAPRYTPNRDWAAATAGRTFAEDLNSDGSLKTEDDA